MRRKPGHARLGPKEPVVPMGHTFITFVTEIPSILAILGKKQHLSPYHRAATFSPAHDLTDLHTSFDYIHPIFTT